MGSRGGRKGRGTHYAIESTFRKRPIFSLRDPLWLLTYRKCRNILLFCGSPGVRMAGNGRVITGNRRGPAIQTAAVCEELKFALVGPNQRPVVYTPGVLAADLRASLKPSVSNIALFCSSYLTAIAYGRISRAAQTLLFPPNQ